MYTEMGVASEGISFVHRRDHDGRVSFARILVSGSGLAFTSSINKSSLTRQLIVVFIFLGLDAALFLQSPSLPVLRNTKGYRARPTITVVSRFARASTHFAAIAVVALVREAAMTSGAVPFALGAPLDVRITSRTPIVVVAALLAVAHLTGRAARP